MILLMCWMGITLIILSWPKQWYWIVLIHNIQAHWLNEPFELKILQNWGKISATLKSFKRNNNGIGTFNIPLIRHKYFWRTHWHILSDLSFSRQNPYHVQLREWLPRRHLKKQVYEWQSKTYIIKSVTEAYFYHQFVLMNPP